MKKLAAALLILAVSFCDPIRDVWPQIKWFCFYTPLAWILFREFPLFWLPAVDPPAWLRWRDRIEWGHVIAWVAITALSWAVWLEGLKLTGTGWPSLWTH